MDKMYDVPKKKPKELDSKFGVKVNKKPKPKPSKLKGEGAMKEYQKQISPEGMAKFEADAKKAIEKKYPGLFIPETKISPPRLKRK
jgi:hypothetical protein